MPNRGMFSSASDNWETPQSVFDGLDAEFGFNLDACASAENAKCKKYFDRDADGLQQEWTGTVWMNPPYGREISAWMKRAYESSLSGATVVCLVPARTDTKWWHDYALRGERRFYKGRLKFGGSKNAAPFPSAVVVFRPPMSADVQNPVKHLNQRASLTNIGNDRADSPMLTVSEAAIWMSVSSSTIYSLVRSGRLASHRIGMGRGTIRIELAEIERYLEQGLNGQQQTAALRHITL